MRGNIWLDKHFKVDPNDNGLPPLRISSDTSKFEYKRKGGHRYAIRITRIVSETLRLDMKNVRWFVMGDDDTFFVRDNLVKVLQKYDHNSYYYIGSTSESHLQNIDFSYNMAYGGGGFAISYPFFFFLSRYKLSIRASTADVQMPNIWHIWHPKHKNGALSDVLNVSNFCNMLQYRYIFDTIRTQMAFVLYYFFIHLSLLFHSEPLHLHFSGSYSLSSLSV